MPKSQEEIKKALKELSVKGGGSLVKRIKKTVIAESANVLFIGLGGMGCDTINVLKKNFVNDYADNGQVKFLAIDSHKDALKDIDIAHGGFLTKSEQFELYSSDATQLLVNPPANVRSWLGRDLEPVLIQNDGAQGTRQIGRIMLCGTTKYTDLQNKIKLITDELYARTNLDHPLHVILISGIAGGTGSGTFIDIGYMIRNILDEYNDKNRPTFYFGAFYLPDVQKNVDEIRNNPAIWERLEKNGYAALKELDYFMNNGTLRAGAKPIYRLKLVNNVEVTSAKPLFNKNKVFLISATDTYDKKDEIINATALSLLNMYHTTNISSKFKGNPQSVLGTFCNSSEDVSTWENDHVGKHNRKDEENVIPDRIDDTPYPAFMSYNYSSFGYASIYIPRDEMMTYCANTVFQEVIKKWKNINILNQDTVVAFAKGYKIESIESIYNLLIEVSHLNLSSLRIPSNDNTVYPYKRKFLGYGKYGNIEEAKQEADNLAEGLYNQLVSLNQDNRLLNQMYLPIENIIKSKDFLTEYGPFVAIAILSGLNKDSSKNCIQGCIDNLDYMLSTELINKTDEKKKEFEEKLRKLENETNTMLADKTPTDAEIKDYIDVCYQYSLAKFEYMVYANAMPNTVYPDGRIANYGIIGYLAYRLNELNHETFQIFIPIIQTLSDMLSDESHIFAEGKLTKGGNRTVYSMDIFNIDKSEHVRDRFKALFDGYVDDDAITKISNQFADSMFNSPDKWRQFLDENNNATEEFADEIRRIFNEFLTPLVNNMLVKFLVLTYAREEDIREMFVDGKIAPQALTELWNNQDQKQQIIATAVEVIKSALSNQLLLKYKQNALYTNANSLTSLIIPQSISELREHLVHSMGDSFSYNIVDDTDSSIKSVLTLVMYQYPIPLALVNNLDNYAREYFRSEGHANSRSGRHMVENGDEDWTVVLPELYGVDTERYYVDYCDYNDMEIADTDRAVNKDLIQYKKIINAFSFGVRNGYIYTDDTNSKYIFLRIKKPDIELATLLSNTLTDLKVNDPDATWIDALKKIDPDGDIYSEVYLDKFCSNDILKAAETKASKNREGINNIHRIIRFNIQIQKMVIDACDKYTEIKFFDVMKNAGDFIKNISYFAKALIAGLIKYDSKLMRWTCKYGSNPEPVVFFEDYLPKNDLDVSCKWLLVFTAFTKALSEDLMQTIDNDYESSLNPQNKTAKRRQDVLDELSAVFSDPMWSLRPYSVRNDKIENLLKNSNYKDYYNMPNICTNYDALEDNIKKVQSALKGKLDVTV